MKGGVGPRPVACRLYSLIFQTGAQRDAFLAAVGLAVDDGQYVDGVAFARRLGIELPPCDQKPRLQKPDKDFADLAL